MRLHNAAKEQTSAVDDIDHAIRDGLADPPKAVLCEGLGSLTGSPHFMAPEVLLQAARYLCEEGLARNVLEDYITQPSRLPDASSASLLNVAHRDFKRGWGLKADLWSWGCSTLSLLLRTIDDAERPSSQTVCAFDFSFDSQNDALFPLWPVHPSNNSLPRFHQWARQYPLRIMEIVHKGVTLPVYSKKLSPTFHFILQSVFQQQDSRPSATTIISYLDSHSGSNVEYMEETQVTSPNHLSRCNSSTLSSTSMSTTAVSLPDEPHNVDLSSGSGEMRGATKEVALKKPELTLTSSANPGMDANGIDCNERSLAYQSPQQNLLPLRIAHPYATTHSTASIKLREADDAKSRTPSSHASSSRPHDRCESPPKGKDTNYALRPSHLPVPVRPEYVANASNRSTHSFPNSYSTEDPRSKMHPHCEGQMALEAIAQHTLGQGQTQAIAGQHEPSTAVPLTGTSRRPLVRHARGDVQQPSTGEEAECFVAPSTGTAMIGSEASASSPRHQSRPKIRNALPCSKQTHFKTSSGHFLGLELGYRSVLRGAKSLVGLRTSASELHLAMDAPTTPMVNAPYHKGASKHLAFMHSDPFARPVAGHTHYATDSDQGGAAVGTQGDHELSSASCAPGRRQRSWSSIFKRKKA